MEISDIRQYPIPVKIYGCVGELKAAGVTLYPILGQLFADKSPDLFVVTVVGAVVKYLVDRVKGGPKKG